LATPIVSSLKHWRLSAEIISVEKCWAICMPSSVLPTAVGPDITMQVFLMKTDLMDNEIIDNLILIIMD